MADKFFSIHLCLILTLFVGQTDCFALRQIRKVKFGENFTLQPDESVATEDLKLKVSLKGVGRTIAESGEVEYVELQISLNKSEEKVVISERGNRTKTVGGYVIKLVNAESFGKTNCQLKISRKS